MTSAGLGPARRELRTRGGLVLVADEWRPATAGCSVLLLHGGGQTRHSWKDAGARLAAAGCTTLALDLRGHGDSEWDPDGRYDSAAIAEDVMDVVEVLPRPLVLVGASLGGLAALQAGAWLGRDVDAVVMVDVVPRTEKAGVERIVSFLGSAPDGFATLEDASDAIADYLPHRSRRGVTPGLRKNLRRRADGRWYWHWDPAMLAASRETWAQRTARLEAAAAEVEVPVLVVRGLLSDVVSQEGIADFVARGRDVRVVDLAGAAHTAAADDNDAFVTAVVELVTALR